MFHDAMWDGLLQWCATDETLARELVLRRASVRSIRKLVCRDRLSEITCEDFSRTLCGAGRVLHPDGTPVEPHRLGGLRPARLDNMIRSGDLAVAGNYLLDPPKVRSQSMRPDSRRLQPRQTALPGLGNDEGDERLRRFLRRLLEPGADPVKLMESIDARELPFETSALSKRAIISLILSLCTHSPWAILDDRRIRGLHRLELLTGIDADCSDGATYYERLSAALTQMCADSEGMLLDPLAADLLLCRLDELRPPQAWKVAVGLRAVEADEATVAKRCIEGGFAAIAPSDPDDINITRLKSLVPGDCVVMHLRGRIGAIGRVTRPYHEIDRKDADPLDRRWWRRIGVDWLEGDRDYGELLSGAQKRFSVVRLEPEVFREIANLYRHDPGYDRLIRPLRGAWIFHCDETRSRTLASLDRPLPLRDRWTVQIDASEDAHCGHPEPGDLVFVHREPDRVGEEAPSGICGVGRVIGEAVQAHGGENGSRRVDLLYEHLPGVPVAPSVLDADARIDRWRPPQGSSAGSVTPETAAALRDHLGFSSPRHFVLLAGGSTCLNARRPVRYRIGNGDSGCSDELREAAANGGPRCLIYHGSPDNSLVGFGTVTEVAQENGCHEVILDARQFAHRIECASGGFSACRDPVGEANAAGEAGSERAGFVRAVLPVSVYDFYRVIGAGMVTREVAEAGPGLDDLAEQTGAPQDRLEEIERLLREKGQMILYGPPGTGKTWLALQLAEYLTGGHEDRCEIVQFHPSYSYEDLIEGIRPRAVEGPDGRSTVEYPLVPGSFKLFCERARRGRRYRYVFVIDEINRARVAQVFGELMMALEYRGREVQLAHARTGADATAGAGAFSIPPNVLVIGTMNTADRSAALIDYALRRRFVFYPLYPDDAELVRPVFKRWLSRNAPDALWVLQLQGRLNEWLSAQVGRHLLIGHTYFMREGLTEDDVREIWRFQLYPLLEEYFAGAPEHLKSIDIDELILQARADSERSPTGATATRSEASDGHARWGESGREG